MATAYDALQEALELAYSHIGWCWDKIEANTKLHREGSSDILLRIETAIANAKRLNAYYAEGHDLAGLPVPGKWNVADMKGNPIPDAIVEGKETGTPTDPTPLSTGSLNPISDTRTYSVTWRKPTSSYAHDEIEATSAEDALMKAKARVTSNRRDEPFFETNTDSEGPCDWISVEPNFTPDNNEETVEWEEPKLSPAKLMLALTTIMNRAKNMGVADQSKNNMLQALQFIENIARCAIDAVPGRED